MTERCAVCGRECERTISIFVFERGRLVSKYACPDCDRAWLAANAPQGRVAEAQPAGELAELPLFCVAVD